MTKGKILGDIHQIDKDVELCRTTNERISNMYQLIDEEETGEHEETEADAADPLA